MDLPARIGPGAESQSHRTYSSRAQEASTRVSWALRMIITHVLSFS